MTFRPEPGWVGVFTREQADGAIPNGERIVKTNSEEGDGNPDGSEGVVLGSAKAPPGTHAEAERRRLRPPTYFYFVEWDNLPRHAVGLVDWKITRKDA